MKRDIFFSLILLKFIKNVEWKKEIFKEIDHVEKWKIYMILLKSFFSFEYVFSNLKKDKTKEIFEEIDWKKKKEEYI